MSTEAEREMLDLHTGSLGECYSFTSHPPYSPADSGDGGPHHGTLLPTYGQRASDVLMATHVSAGGGPEWRGPPRGKCSGALMAVRSTQRLQHEQQRFEAGSLWCRHRSRSRSEPRRSRHDSRHERSPVKQR
jgi:hypothetical protein